VAVLPERARNQVADCVLVLCDQNARQGPFPLPVRSPGLLSALVAGTRPRLDGSGRPLTNSQITEHRVARGPPRELENRENRPSGAWRAPSPTRSKGGGRKGLSLL